MPSYPDGGLGVTLGLDAAETAAAAAGEGVAVTAEAVVGADAGDAAGVAREASTDVEVAGGLVGAGVEVATGGPSRKATAPRPIAAVRV
jgi:hypothetical protein